MKTTFQTPLNSWKKSFSYIFSCMSFLMIFFLNIAHASEPKPWQMDLQEPAGIIASKATDLHNFLLVVRRVKGFLSFFKAFLRESYPFLKPL